jgi:hypothetical protein
LAGIACPGDGLEPKLTEQQRIQIGLRPCRRPGALAPNQNIENNPMQSKPGRRNDFGFYEIDFDTSGKSPAIFHHRGIFRTPMIPPDTNDCFRHSGACAAGTRNLVAITSGFSGAQLRTIVRAKWRAPE